jgi:hypothetical protein
VAGKKILNVGLVAFRITAVGTSDKYILQEMSLLKSEVNEC